MNSWLRMAALCVVAFQVMGCATAKPSARKGLLDEPKALKRTIAAERTAGGRFDENPVDEKVFRRVKQTVSRWNWPLRDVAITSPFGWRGGENEQFHEGIDLKAKIGTPIHAAHSGMVIYAGHKIRGYGKMIVVRHGNGLSTIYAHNSRLLVRPGQKVRRGQRIALSGNTGISRGPHLHFEIRRGVVALDPNRLLPFPRTEKAETIRKPAPHPQKVAAR